MASSSDPGEGGRVDEAQGAGSPATFEEVAYPHAPRDIARLLRERRDVIRKFLTSKFGTTDSDSPSHTGLNAEHWKAMDDVDFNHRT